MSIISLAHTVIQPVLNEFGGEIYGGFVRDLVVNETPKDIDINLPYNVSPANVDKFRYLLNRYLSSDYKIKSFDYCNKRYLEFPFGSKVNKHDIVIIDKNNNEYNIDLIWDNLADRHLDVDIHALYLDKNWGFRKYPQFKYRHALTNAINKQFINLDSTPYRIEKIKKKGFTEFVKGTLLLAQPLGGFKPEKIDLTTKRAKANYIHPFINGFNLESSKLKTFYITFYSDVSKYYIKKFDDGRDTTFITFPLGKYITGYDPLDNKKLTEVDLIGVPKGHGFDLSILFDSVVNYQFDGLFLDKRKFDEVFPTSNIRFDEFTIN